MPLGVPIRPSETSPTRLQAWQNRREQVGARIRELRIARDLTQEALGLEAGLHRSMVVSVEWGRRTLAYERLWDVAEVLGVDVLDLFTKPSNLPTVAPHRRGRSKSNTRTRLSSEPDPK
ncbi:helix-turn-helix domain-containing protein [Arthrobacter flavus]|uniref:Helix-turn-helix domain-containing protein n=1 Tax=Arthrobacter flavus TaxID=95172 RepID=A0ABW4QA79_9MICC